MEIRKISDSDTIEKHLRKSTELNLYQIGDLDEFFRKYTNWFGCYNNDLLKQIAMLYNGTSLPVLIALCDRDLNEMKYLLNEIKKELPDKLYSHLSIGLSETLEKENRLTFYGRYLKMTLSRKNFSIQNGSNYEPDKNIRRLSVSEIEQIQNFYKESYPDNWFDKRMLETGKYFGYFKEESGKLTGISGVHVYSPVYKVAVLGNIATDPAIRGKSICRKTTTALCRDLFESVDIIGLNVSRENIAAIKSYENIGFEITGEYEEYMIEKKQLSS